MFSVADSEPARGLNRRVSLGCTNHARHKDQCAARLFSLLKAQSFIARPCRATIDPHGFAALARTMVGHTGGAPPRSRDLATERAGGGIGVSRRAGIGFSCHGGNGEGCCHHKRQQGRGRNNALHHHRLQFYYIRLCEMVARTIRGREADGCWILHADGEANRRLKRSCAHVVSTSRDVVVR
jgi:hypothetical protein